jgi:photosystem II stability/assembly factor-like uncharacterized protein
MIGANMQLRRNVLLALMIVLFIYFEIHSCSEDRLTDPGNDVEAPSIICNASDVVFPGEDFGWVIGALGTMMATSDGGRTWKGVLIDGINLRGVFFRNEECGWVVGKTGKVYRTTDGGATWDRMIFSGRPLDDDLFKVRFYNDTLGYILGYHGVFKTIDCGKFWINNWLPSVPYRGAWDMCMVNESLGYLLGSCWTETDPVLIYRTDDGGENWTGVDGSRASILKTILTIKFINRDTGWAGGGVIMKTTDGGESWVRQVDDAVVREFFFLDVQYGFAVGGQKILRTFDGGTKWEDVTPEDDRIEDLRGVYFIDGNRGWVVGRGGEEYVKNKIFKHSIILDTSDGGDRWNIKDFRFDYTPYLDGGLDLKAK